MAICRIHMLKADISAVSGTVRIQVAAMLAKRRQLTPCFAFCALPTITTEPTLQWVVEMGSPIFEAINTVIAAPISMVNQVVGVILVRSEPIVWITLRPQTHRPIEMPMPPYRRMYQGVSPLESPSRKMSITATSGPIALLQMKIEKVNLIGLVR